MDIVARYVAPPILGGAAGLLSPWAAWGIEKRRQKLDRRRQLVTGWRMNLIPMIGQPQSTQFVWAGDRQRAVMSSPFYASLRPHLSASAIREIEDPAVKLFVQIDKSKPRTEDWSHHFPLKTFVDEIARIESDWKLV